MAIQVARRKAGRDIVLKHLGSAHTRQQLDHLIQLARQYMFAGQPPLFDDPLLFTDMVALSSSSTLLYQTLGRCYDSLGFQVLSDRVFQQLVVARLIEPSSKLDTVRILAELGVNPPSNTGIHRCLARVIAGAYRNQISRLCFKERGADNLSLLLYDVTTLYFETQKTDDFRKPGLSKERRLDPQIVVGLLVDKTGFPLEIHKFEGNLAETKTIIPVIAMFCQKHHINARKMTITADAGMLSADNLRQLEKTGFSFIVGSRIAKTPYQIRQYSKTDRHEQLSDGHIFETTQTFGYRQEDKIARRVIYQYKHKRAQLDLSNIDKQVIKAEGVVNGTSPIKRDLSF